MRRTLVVSLISVAIIICTIRFMIKHSVTPRTQFVWSQQLPQQTVITSLNNVTRIIGVAVRLM
jgi:hypothetical protein